MDVAVWIYTVALLMFFFIPLSIVAHVPFLNTLDRDSSPRIVQREANLEALVFNSSIYLLMLL